MATTTNLGMRQGDPLDSQSARLAIHRLFADSPYHELRQIHVDVTPGKIGLSGIVPSYFIKQLAQETVRQFSGERKIDNRIRVT